MLPRHIYQGYTVVELIVTLSIVSILAVVSIPYLGSIIQRNRISGTADNLYYYIQNARSEAVKRNANVYVSFVSGDSWCYGMNVGASCNCAIANNCGLGVVSAATSQQITLSTSGLSSNSIYFEGTHGAANASGTITLTLYGQSSYITISVGRLGNLQICASGIGGYQSC